MRKFSLVLILFTLVLINGCGEKNESSGDKKDAVRKESNDNAVLIEDEAKKNDVTKDDPLKDDASKSNDLGMTPGLPKDFPADIPQPKNAKTLGSLNSSEGVVVTFESTDKVQDIVNFYKEEMKKNGFSITEGGENLVSDKGGLINWSKDKRDIGLMLGYDKDKNITSLVITYK